ncbi:hypothetical protein P4U90_22405 [Cytobacillus kochii]|uniref:hypothetical protein n=1 Tax=Cytobacillus kochii TaxID=859143 RepID=UPI002E21D0E7|nr:hypothetical protein [Cytobacillus kochii]
MKDFFIQSLQQTFTKYVPMLSESNLSSYDVKVLSEYSFLLQDIINSFEFESYEKALLERLFIKFNNILYTGERIFYYSSFYYLPRKFASVDVDEISKATFKVNIDINIMRLQIISGGVTGSSEDEYFFSRGQNGLLRAMQDLAKKDVDDTEVFVPAFYTLLNYHQAIMEYLESDNKLYLNEAERIIEETNKIINEFSLKQTIKDKLVSDYQISFFLENEVKRFKSWKNQNYNLNRIDVEGFKEYKNVSKKNWAFLSFSNIDSNNFIAQFKDDFSTMYEYRYNKLKAIEQIIFLRNIVKWLYLEQNTYITDISIPVFEKFNDKHWFELSNYFNGYEKISNVTISDDDREKVEQWDDYELRSKVGNTIINIDRAIIDKESVKPHGVFEISDMELPIKIKGSFYNYYLCMPFKSGREIKGKVKEDITYQVFRPFTYFGEKAIVVFVSVKEATEPFYNAIKRAKTNLNWEVHSLIGENLIKLLKYNKQI